MKVHKLFQLVLSTAEKGLWWDHDERGYTPKGWGLTVKLLAGPVVRPVTKPQYWFKHNIPSRWNEFDPQWHWLIKIPFFVGPFVSVAIGEYGFYFGFKVFDLESKKYEAMVGAEEVYHGSQALTPSATTRRTRWR